MPLRLRALLAALLTLLVTIVVVAPAQARDTTVTSYDGTKINTHFFPTSKTVKGKAPTVLMGPGWSQPGDTNTAGTTDVNVGAPGVGTLLAAGYNVVTWDPRGFGKSTGTVTVDWAGNEGRDVKAIISYVAKQPEAKLDKKGDPRVGMAGASYGGGIQLVTAAIDKRVDAIVPIISWHSLRTALYKADTVKTGWSSLLYGLGSATGGKLDPHIGHAYQSGLQNGRLDQDDYNWFLSRGPGDLVNKIRIPTLFIQGTVDTLFTLDEATTNYKILRHNGVPTKMLWFCGGHGTCLTNPGDPGRIQRDTLNWLGRYLKRNKKVKTGVRFEWLDQDGTSASARDYPLRHLTSLVGGGSGTLPLTTAGGSGPAVPNQNPGAVGVLAAPVAPAKAANAVNVTIPAPKVRRSVLGAPLLRMTYSGTTLTGSKDGRVQAQIVDDQTGHVLGNQITPIKVMLDGKTHKVVSKLEILAATAKPGHTFTLQVVASSVAYAPQQATGALTLKKIDIALPVADRKHAPPGWKQKKKR
jgi:ABC-2 type transport system ATP-binding protein